MTSPITRLAPSPTGSLHIGNICTFLLNWVIAKQRNWKIVFRMEDIDGPRKKSIAIEESIDILRWIGIDWDGEIVIQSDRIDAHQEMLHTLIEKDLAYHCSLTRKELNTVLSAPHETFSSKDPIYRPANVRLHNSSLPNIQTNWRFVSERATHVVHDELYGAQICDTSHDFVIWTKDNSPTYQLAVVADDHYQHITHIIRGNDLLQSAAWQELLFEAMGWETPTWIHLPLVIGSDGKRVAKRHGDSRISTYRSRGVSPERIIGLIAMWTHAQIDPIPMSLEKFLHSFDLDKLQPNNIVFTKEDETWLLD
ncbi:MAG: tRNA glutamyl-Q(34) synthetase GluQRS [Phycisphaerales bacterium]|nr:tRNA glutamyl-Q(34) synthetase GluQRS [Phycisphaerales bacterium]